MSAAANDDARFERELSDAEKALVAEAARKAHVLYEGRQVSHRSCGIALAETFGLPSAPYQALRKGGITGAGECGAIKAGELVLGELLGDPDPAGPVTEELRLAAAYSRGLWEERVDRGAGGSTGSIVCNDLTSPFDDFMGEPRQQFCTSIASRVAGAVAEILVRLDALEKVTPIPGLETDEGS
ncbi:MAG: C-GCAxxG-C-C family protein [Planctomycetota bacterium]|nr:C-GCAxxG-C-C family protein [Planctomycetota bacterium]